MEKNRPRIKNLKISKQLITVYFLVAFIPTVIIGGCLITNTYNLIMKQHYGIVESDNLRVKSIILDMTTAVDNVGEMLFNDSDIQQLLSDTETTMTAYNGYKLQKKFSDFIGYHTEISNIKIYSDNANFYNNVFVNANSDIKDNQWYMDAVATPVPRWEVVETINTVNSVVYELRYIRRIPIISTGKYAVLVITISQNNLKSRIENNGLYTEIVVDDSCIFYASTTSLFGDSLDIDIDSSNPYYQYEGKVKYRGKDAIVTVSSVSPVSSDNNFHIVTIDNEAIPYTLSIMVVCLLLVIVCIIVPFIMIIIYTKTFARRIYTLRHVMHKVSHGNYNVQESITGSDELTEAFIDLKKMIESIKEMDNKIYSVHIREEQFRVHQQRMKYELLASQINPHFLYNTLETIRMMAFSAGDKEAAKATKLLGKSMRHVLDNSMKTVRLSKEIEYIRTYLEIQHLRFGDRIKYNIHIDKGVDTENYYILPLLLQPIVENAINHGVELVTESGVVDIYVERTDDYLAISVKDNGIGMDEEVLNELRKKVELENNVSSESIGLHNICQRIKIFYGKGYGMDINSEKGVGTTVVLRLFKESPEEIILDEGFYGI